MIFFIVAILILPVYYRRRWLGWLLVLPVSVSSVALTAWLIVKYDLGPYVFDQHYIRYSYYAYSKPYCRIGAYLVGVTTAWIMDNCDKSGITRETIRRNRKASILLRCASILAFAVLITLVLLPHTDFGHSANAWGTTASNMFLNLGRIVWAMCWAAMTFSCYYNVTSALDRFLSHWIWMPFCRLTYGAYLCHPLVIKLMAGRSFQFYEFGTQDLVYRLIANATLAFSASVVLWCLIERPVMTLVSRFTKKGQKPQRQQQPEEEPPQKVER
jgi:hypothetical protein